MPPPLLGRALQWVGVLLCVLALVAVVVPATAYARDAGKTGVVLGNGPERVTLPAGREYGIYVDDTDNSGYSEECSITDAAAGSVELRDPWFTVSSSGTEVLDIVFDTGSGRLVVNCSISAERVTVRPVPDLRALLLGIVLAVVLAGLGALSFVGRRRLDRRPLPPALPAPGWYPDPQARDRMRYWDGHAWTEHLQG